MNLDDLLGMGTSSTSAAPNNNVAGGGLSGLDFGGVSQPVQTNDIFADFPNAE
jgi:hypothetical protein